MKTKNQQIKDSLIATRNKRKNQVCKVYEIKLISNKMNISQKEFLNRVFLEAKWMYNDILNHNDLKTYDTKKKQVEVLNKDKEVEIREITTLGSQIKQELMQRTWGSIKSLSTKKKKGRSKEVGRLKFKSEINSIPLKQYGVTYKFVDGKLKIQNCKKIFVIKGFNQIPEEAEFANANLIRKPSGYYLKVTCFLSIPETKLKSKEVIGIDFGIKDDLTLSNGVKLQTKFPVNKNIKKIQRNLSKKTKGSNHYYKQKQKLAKAWEKQNNKKKDVINKIVSYLKNNFSHIAIQNENIKGWHSGLFGKQIQQSILGGIISELKKLPQTSVVDRFFPSTKLCPKCGVLNTPSLSDREYICECGYSQDRDVHSAMNILLETIPTEHRNFKPVEFNTSMLDVLESFISINYEAGRYNSLELC
jgi:putative transposase